MNEWINILDYKDSKDINGKKAGTVIITTNRSGGKTTSVLNTTLDYYLETGRCSLMFFRDKADIKDIDKMYADVLTRRNDVGAITTSMVNENLIAEVMLDGEVFCYGVSLKDADRVKKYSAMFAKVDYAFFDEYQSETGKYLPGEVSSIISLIISISRGGGYASRSIQLFLLGNNYTLLNPYLMEFKISDRYRKGMRRIRAKGCCAYFIQSDRAKQQMENNLALEAFRDTRAYKYATESDFWIADNNNLIGKPKGKTWYICTLIYDGKTYGLWDCVNEGYICLTRRVIDGYRHVYCLSGDGSGNGVRLMKRSSSIWKIIQGSYNEGMIRFENMECKSVLMQFLSKGLYTR